MDLFTLVYIFLVFLTWKNECAFECREIGSREKRKMKYNRESTVGSKRSCGQRGDGIRMSPRSGLLWGRPFYCNMQRKLRD